MVLTTFLTLVSTIREVTISLPVLVPVLVARHSRLLHNHYFMFLPVPIKVKVCNCNLPMVLTLCKNQYLAGITCHLIAVVLSVCMTYHYAWGILWKWPKLLIDYNIWLNLNVTQTIFYIKSYFFVLLGFLQIKIIDGYNHVFIAILWRKFEPKAPVFSEFCWLVIWSGKYNKLII